MAANSKPSPERAGDREKSLETALLQIERQFGKGSVMRLGEETRVPVEVIPTGSIALDVALGLGGLPRGRIVEIYGPESSGKTSLALHAVANAQKAGGIAAFIDAEHALDPTYARELGVNIDELLVSQPDSGEQALEIADTLVRSGAIDVVVIDSVAALVVIATLWRHHSRRIVFPDRFVCVNIEFDFVAVRIAKIETLAHGVVTHALDGDAGSFKIFLRRSQFIEAVSDLDTDVIQPSSTALRRPWRITDLDQEQLMMRSARRQRGSRTIEDPAHFVKPQQVTIER